MTLSLVHLLWSCAASLPPLTDEGLKEPGASPLTTSQETPALKNLPLWQKLKLGSIVIMIGEQNATEKTNLLDVSFTPCLLLLKEQEGLAVLSYFSLASTRCCKLDTHSTYRVWCFVNNYEWIFFPKLSRKEKIQTLEKSQKWKECQICVESHCLQSSNWAFQEFGQECLMAGILWGSLDPSLLHLENWMRIFHSFNLPGPLKKIQREF